MHRPLVGVGGHHVEVAVHQQRAAARVGARGCGRPRWPGPARTRGSRLQADLGELLRDVLGGAPARRRWCRCRRCWWCRCAAGRGRGRRPRAVGSGRAEAASLVIASSYQPARRRAGSGPPGVVARGRGRVPPRAGPAPPTGRPASPAGAVRPPAEEGTMPPSPCRRCRPPTRGGLPARRAQHRRHRRRRAPAAAGAGRTGSTGRRTARRRPPRGARSAGDVLTADGVPAPVGRGAVPASRRPCGRRCRQAGELVDREIAADAGAADRPEGR